MSSTKSNQRSAPHKYRSWLGAATAAALVAGSATMSMAAPRTTLRSGAVKANANFQWQAFKPKHIVRIETPSGSQGTMSDVRTEALSASTMSFTWQTFSPGHIVNNESPNGSSAGMNGTQSDALRLPASFSWQRFTPRHYVDQQPANGTDINAPGDLNTDALRHRASRPTLFLGLDRDGVGGVRTEVGLSFRIP